MNHLWCEKGAYVSKKTQDKLVQFDPKKIRRIAVIRHAALGDHVITRPFLIEARRFFPNAEITLSLVSKYQYAAPTDLVDRVHTLENDASLPEYYRQLKALGEQDIIFDLAATARSFTLSFLTPARLKIGFPYRAIHRKLYDIAILRSDFHPEVECLLDMLNILGCVPAYPLQFSLADHRQLKEREKPYFTYFIGASEDSKRYPEADFKNLIAKTCALYPDHQHVLLEGVKENEKGDAFKELTTRFTNFTIQTAQALEKTTNAIARASLLVSSDTGIRNLAIATHTPTVGIFFSTVPFRYWPRYEPGHQIVAEPNGSLPSVDAVLSGIKRLLQSC